MSNSNDYLKQMEEALGGFLTSQQIRSAKEIWLEEFSHHAIFVPFAFAKRLSADFSLERRQTQEVARRLKSIGREESAAQNHSTTNASSSILKSSSKSDPSSKDPLKPRILMDDSTFVFNALLERLLKRLVLNLPEGLDKFSKHLNQELANLKLSSQSNQLVKSWIRNLQHEIAPLGGLKETDMTAIIHSIYVWACNEVGPVADRQISQIIKEVEQLPEAMSFGPRRLF